MSFRNALLAQVTRPYKQHLHYIESTGTQCINTGIVASATTEIEIRLTPTTATPRYPFGSIASIAHKNYGVSFTPATHAMTCYYGTVADWSVYLTGGSWTQGTATTIKIASNGKFYQDGSLIADYTDYSPVTKEFDTVPIKLLYYYGVYAYFKIHCCKMWQDGVLKRDMIPVLDSSNDACLYDQISKAFFRNAGSGSFLYE